MSKKLSIKVGKIEESIAAYKTAWSEAEKGKLPRQAVESIYFENTFLLLKMLTTRRLELMQYLHTQGSSSIRALAKKLKRDYKNVHTDIKKLEQCGLVLCRDELYSVPWDSIKTEIPMEIKAA